MLAGRFEVQWGSPTWRRCRIHSVLAGKACCELGPGHITFVSIDQVRAADDEGQRSLAPELAALRLQRVAGVGE